MAVALAAVLVLSLVALSLTALTGNQKAGDLTVGQQLAHQRLEELIYAAQQDGSLSFWSANSGVQPYLVEPLHVGNHQFETALYITEVSDPNLPALRRCRLRVWWWGGDQSHAGYGRLSAEVVRFASRP